MKRVVSRYLKGRRSEVMSDGAAVALIMSILLAYSIVYSTVSDRAFNNYCVDRFVQSK
jgi:hypothetical protein